MNPFNESTVTSRAVAPEGMNEEFKKCLKQDLTRKTQFIRKSLMDEYLEDLVESGELVVKFGANGGEVYFPGD